MIFLEAVFLGSGLFMIAIYFCQNVVSNESVKLELSQEQIACSERRVMDSAFKNLAEADAQSLVCMSYQQIGIDRLQLCNLSVLSIDIEWLFSTGVQISQVAMEPNIPRKYRISGTNRGISKITVKDNMAFFELVIGCKNIYGNKWVEYACISLTIPDEKGNLVPWNIKKYNDFISKVIDYIYERYHIKINCDCAKVKYIEINCNIPLTYNFCLYTRPIRLLITLMDNHLRKLGSYERVSRTRNGKKLEGESFFRGNKSMEVIFYDKQRQMNETKKDLPKIDTPILRLEYRLKTKEKIEFSIGTNSWNKLTNKLIADYFISYTRKELSLRFQKWMEVRKKELIRLIKECRKNNSQGWHHDLLTDIRNRREDAEIAYILDIEQVREAIKMIPDKNRSRKIRSLERLLTNDDVYKNKDLEKAFEILSGIEQAYKNTILQCDGFIQSGSEEA